MNTVREIERLNKRELENAVPPEASWHTDYRDTAYIHIGGLPFTLTEGDILTIFSQFGEPTYLHLARDKDSGKSRGFGWLKYEDQRSTDLAVDNLGGATLMGRVVRVDHARYKRKEGEDSEEERRRELQGGVVGSEVEEEEEEEEGGRGAGGRC
ncbi:MAG: RNA-binding protein Cwf29 [Ramalina farinacea]|uniref:RNA-binding protein Cwf29 n=1 Tax=Ramalina farinacea TaxID=258253 RepID=A0AA43QTC1_9LECA|nr:RNA-binding protein Cwf29 [Ramalina farinacea]